MDRCFALASLLILAGCEGRVAQEAANLDTNEIVSASPGIGGVTFAIRKTYEGGATGDTVHEAWVCRYELSNCQRAAVIDTHDGPPPSWRVTEGGATLLISTSDAVWNYTNSLYGNDRKLLRLKITDDG